MAATQLDAASKGADLTLSGGNLIATNNAVNWGAPEFARSDTAKTGKLYFEARLTTFPSQTIAVGVGSSTSDFGSGGYQLPGSGAFGGGCINIASGSGGTIYFGGSSSTPSIGTFAQGDYVAVCIKTSANKIWFGRIASGGTTVTWDGDPSAETGGQTLTGMDVWYPFVGPYVSNTSTRDVTINFGATAFAAAALPTGASAYDGGADNTPVVIGTAYPALFDRGLNPAAWFDNQPDANSWFDEELAQASGPATYNSTLSESAAAGATQTSTAIWPATLSESAAPGDALAGGLLLAGTLSESAAPGDATTGALTLAVTLAEAAIPDSTASTAATFASTLSEAATAGDSSTAANTLTVTLGEAVTPGEASVAGLTLAGARTEAATPGDALTAVAVWNAALGEAATPADGAVAAQTMPASLAQATTPGEALATVATWGTTLGETALASDAAAAVATFVSALGEGSAAGAALADELIHLSGTTYNSTLAEAATPGEALAPGLAIPVALAEPGALGEAVAAGLTIPALLSESQTAGAALTGGAVLTGAVAETLAANDDLTVQADFTALLAEATLAAASAEYEREPIPGESVNLAQRTVTIGGRLATVSIDLTARQRSRQFTVRHGS